MIQKLKDTKWVVVVYDLSLHAKNDLNATVK